MKTVAMGKEEGSSNDHMSENHVTEKTNLAQNYRGKSQITTENHRYYRKQDSCELTGKGVLQHCTNERTGAPTWRKAHPRNCIKELGGG